MTSPSSPALRGSAVGLFLFDVSEEVKLDELRTILGARRLGEGLKHAAAEQLFFERPPVVERVQFPGDPQAQVRVNTTITAWSVFFSNFLLPETGLT